MHYNQVAKWRRRFLRGGIGALQDSPARAAKAISARDCCARSSIKPPGHRRAGYDRTCRAMAREFGVSKATVQRV